MPTPQGSSLDLSPTDLALVAAEATSELAPAFAERLIKLETDLSGALVATVDPARVRQIVTNLLSNAAKFSPQGGDVRVRVERDGHDAVVAVWNSGPGIPAEDLPHIFERFYRGRRPRG